MDLFDFKKYSDIYQIFSRYFSGIELFLRTANMIDYTYDRSMTQGASQELLEELRTANAERLERLTDVINQQSMLLAWYSHYNAKNATEEYVDEILGEYFSCEDVMWNRLYKKYVDDTWKTDTKLWFGDCNREQSISVCSHDKSGAYVIKNDIVGTLSTVVGPEMKEYVANILKGTTISLNSITLYSVLGISFSYCYKYSKEHNTEELSLILNQNSYSGSEQMKKLFSTAAYVTEHAYNNVNELLASQPIFKEPTGLSFQLPSDFSLPGNIPLGQLDPITLSNAYRLSKIRRLTAKDIEILLSISKDLLGIKNDGKNYNKIGVIKLLNGNAYDLKSFQGFK